MRAVVRLNEDDLVFMAVVKWSKVVLLDGKVEDRGVLLHASEQLGVLAVHGCDEVCPPEPKLGWAPTRDENRAVVDSYGDDLFAGQDWQQSFIP